MMRFVRSLLVLYCLGLGSGCYGQDGHYWTQQYGTRSMLLSGSVIGGVEDLGAVYYNPGRLAVISNAAFLLSANVYEYNSINIADAFGNSKNAGKSDIKGVPTLAAGTFKVKFLPKHHFAYAILTRQHSELNFSFSNEVNKDVFATLPGDEYFGADITISQKSLEQWIGVTWSYPVSEKISVGLTTNFSTNNQDKGNRMDMHALSSANEVAMYHYNRNFTYKQNGLIWKAGLAADLANWQLGLTVTTPLVSLSGKGTYNYEEFFSNIPGLSTRPEGYTSSYQKDLNMDYRTPWSVGMGATRILGNNRIHFSTEWYGAIPKYMVMQAADHVSQSDPAQTLSFQLVDQSKSVWNAGIGAEIYMSEKVAGFASFSTDYTTVASDITRFIERQTEASNSAWNVDFYHIGGGVVLKLKGADITLGATRTGGSQTIPRPVNFPDNSGQSIFSPTDTADVTWERWRFVFSFSLPFLADYAKRFTDEKK